MGKLYEKYFFFNYFFTSLKSLKNGVGFVVGSGSAPKCHGSPTLLSRDANNRMNAKNSKDVSRSQHRDKEKLGFQNIGYGGSTAV